MILAVGNAMLIFFSENGLTKYEIYKELLALSFEITNERVFRLDVSMSKSEIV